LNPHALRRRNLKTPVNAANRGFSATSVGKVKIGVDDRQRESQQDPDRSPVATGSDLDPSVDLDTALARALTEATSAGQWNVVLELARQLEARRR